VKWLHEDMRSRGIPDDDVTRWQVKKALSLSSTPRAARGAGGVQGTDRQGYAQVSGCVDRLGRKKSE
jgi:hypothetical protein